MTVEFNHTIVMSKDKRESAEFLAHVLGLEVAAPYGPFLPVVTGNGVSLDYMDSPDAEPVQPQHYAFLISEEEFDAAFGRITALGLTYWADPHGGGRNRINHNDGGRGLYFVDPSGHRMEIITRPYGSGA